MGLTYRDSWGPRGRTPVTLMREDMRKAGLQDGKESADDRRCHSIEGVTRHVHFSLTMPPLLFPLMVCTLVVAAQTQDTVTELQIESLNKPEECERQARRGDMLSMHYRGTLADGTEFDSRSGLYMCRANALNLCVTCELIQLEPKRAVQVPAGSWSGD